MTGVRRRIAQGLVATIVACGLAFIGCGMLSSPGNVWEYACIGLVIAMLGSLFAALALVAATYAGLRARVRRHLRRPVLTDEQFAALLPGPDEIDPERVAWIRELAARSFGRIGGERFYPDDRLEDDLHLRDLAPFASEKFFAGIEEALGLDEDQMLERVGGRPLRTFGELVLAAATIAQDVKPPSEAGAVDQASPLWDRSLDG